MNYQQIYNKIIEKAKTRQIEGYTEKHHVIPKCMGGSDNKNNLVELTAREHFVCHLLLCEIYPDEVKLKQALFLMSIGKQKTKNKHYKISNRTYERLKSEYSLLLIGKPRDQKTKNKISKALKGKKLSNEIKQKISLGRKGVKSKPYKKGNEHKLFGKKKSEEHSKKIGLGHKGKKTHTVPHSEEAKLKISQSKRKWEYIEQIDKNGNIIATFNTQAEAERLYKGVSNVLCGLTKTAKGYFWRHR